MLVVTDTGFGGSVKCLSCHKVAPSRVAIPLLWESYATRMAAELKQTDEQWRTVAMLEEMWNNRLIEHPDDEA